MVNEKTGLITSLYDKRLARDLVDPAKPTGGFRIVWDDGVELHPHGPYLVRMERCGSKKTTRTRRLPGKPLP